MKKTHYIILCLLGLALVSTSCNKRRTYAEILKDETRAIEKFILENKLIVLDEFPSSLVFKTNEFYRDPATGVYFNIIERGDTANKVKEGEEVYVRFSGLRYFTSSNDTTEYSNLDPIRSPFPESLTYRGPVTVMNRSLYSGTTPGWAVPLTYVGHAGRVKMIIPFNMGSQSDQQSYSTTYYDNVQYRFESQL
ncbi:MAG TPA: DUF4827 family protein [Petrimonas sp.]|jgi:hypothetical protein|nr:hypothetical protein [Porphyromonadaceae bacterium]HMM16434.1 DUF4827 family protein [Petrimonas sp.]